VSAAEKAEEDLSGRWKPGPRAPKTMSVVEFVMRVKACKALVGLEVDTRWLGRGTVSFLARHPYGPWCGVTLFNLKDGIAESETGAKMFHGDVAHRLRQLVTDKGDRSWGKQKARARAKRVG
jgi:hypothetical protein